MLLKLKKASNGCEGRRAIIFSFKYLDPVGSLLALSTPQVLAPIHNASSILAIMHCEIYPNIHEDDLALQ
jgi:hypothetical protein